MVQWLIIAAVIANCEAVKQSGIITNYELLITGNSYFVIRN